jgi:flagellar biogenesis protein FliO
MTDLSLQIILALALVVGVIFLLSGMLRKNRSRDGLMQVVGYQSLGPKKGVAAVKIGNNVLILGVTPADLKLFKTLTGEEAGSLTEKKAEQETTIAGEIGEKLRRLKALKDTLR